MATIGKTREKCQVSGIYKVVNHEVTHPKEITISKGETFPPCRKCNRLVKYELVRETDH